MSTLNRTLVSSILFLDIVEYSKQSVTNQIALKQRFNTLLGDVLKHTAPSHRILLDTGDGAAISFQVNPEDPMFVAMHLRDAIEAGRATEPAPRLEVRFGINLGPVRLMSDLNGKVNIVGDGINVAQRVMSFAEPGSILVSRSYYEVVSHLTDDYAKLFSIAGTRTDKHVREHAVYEVGKTISAIHDRFAAAAAQPQTATASPGEDPVRRLEAEMAKLEAEEKARQDAGEKARRQEEDRVRRQAEEQAQAVAKEQLDAELAAWEQARRDEAEKAQREAEQKARQEAEEKARRQEAERIRRQAEEQARAEAEAKARARAEAEQQRKYEAEEQQRREAELRAKLAARQQAQREEEEKLRLEAEAQAAHAARRSLDVSQVKWGKLAVLALPLLLLMAVGALHLVSFTGKAAELARSASEQFGQPVKIEAFHVSLFPPHWRLDGVTIGADAQIKAARVNLAVDLGGLFGAAKSFKSVDFEALTIKPEALNWVLLGQPHGLAMQALRVSALGAKLESSALDLPRFDAKADLDATGRWQKLTLEYADKSVFVELHPGNARPSFEVNANNFTMPFGSEFALHGFTAKGSLSADDISVREFEGALLGGTLQGNATLKWPGMWTLEGNVTAKGISGHELVPALLEAGRINGHANYVMLAPEGKKLFDGARMNGAFSVGEGALSGVDLVHLLQNGSAGGKTSFLELSGSFNYERGHTQLRQLRLGAGLLSASGNADVEAPDRVRGGFMASYTFDNRRADAAVNLGGSLTAPRFSR